METKDARVFADLMTATMGLYNRDIDVSARQIWWSALAQYDYATVRKAFFDHVQASKWAPLPACIIAIINASTGHIPSAEAWALALDSTDEAKTVVWTAQIAQALEAARPLLHAGDKYAARLAFVSAYERLVVACGAPVWSVSLGHDKTLRTDAIRAGVSAGRLSRDIAGPALEALEAPPALEAIEAIEAPAEAKDKATASGLSDARWLALKQSISDSQALRAEQRRAEQMESIRYFEARREDQLRALMIVH